MFPVVSQSVVHFFSAQSLGACPCAIGHASKIARNEIDLPRIGFLLNYFPFSTNSSKKVLLCHVFLALNYSLVVYYSFHFNRKLEKGY